MRIPATSFTAKSTARLLACLIAPMLAACASKPAPPGWQADAASSLAGFSDAYLKGDSIIAEANFLRARDQTASTGRPDLVAHAELVRCATRVASLEYDDCPGFEALAYGASAAQRTYAAYLAGRWQGLDPALLPVQHRAIVGSAASAKGASALGTIDDPLSRLIAAGALFKAGRASPADITAATETASLQGWRRPLLTWLGVSAQRAQAAGDGAELARIRRRIDLASKAEQ
jgi:hypothetical protein